MKKIYTLGLSALMAVTSALATDVTPLHLDGNVEGRIMTWNELRTEFGERPVNVVSPQSLLEMTPRGVKSSAISTMAVTLPSTSEELSKVNFEGSYKGLLKGNQGLHEGDAKFVYYPASGTKKEELHLVLPDYSQGLYVGYQGDGLIIYGKVNYGTDKSGNTIYLCPLLSSNHQPVAENVTVPFNDETGEFEFPSSFEWGLVAVNSAGAMLGYYWAGYDFTLKVSLGDFGINAVLENECTPDNKFKFTVDPGADCASVKALLVNFDADAASLKTAITSLGSEVKAGTTYTVDPVNNHVLASKEGPMTKSGHASILFASYDADGNLMKTQHMSMIVVLEGDEGWKDVANIEYEDLLFSQYYQEFSHKQSAKLQAKTDSPGLYRLVNPYSAYAKMHSADCPHYMIIDISDPEWVSIPFSVSGLDLAGDGILVYGSVAAMGYTKEAAKEKELVSGTLSGQTVTFPVKSIFAHEQYYNAPMQWAFMNSNNAVTFTFPEITLDFIVVDQAEAPVAGAKVTLGETEYTTDASGKAVIAVPLTTGYFGTVKVNVAASGNTEEATVALNGTKTTYTHKVGTAGIEDVVIDVNAPVEYFNLQGIRVDSPTRGLYIKRQGNKAVKVQL